VNVIAKALVCAGMTAAGSVFAETYSFQGTEWDDDMVEAGDFPLEPGTVYAVTCRMRHMQPSQRLRSRRTLFRLCAK